MMIFNRIAARVGGWGGNFAENFSTRMFWPSLWVPVDHLDVH